MSNTESLTAKHNRYSTELKLAILNRIFSKSELPFMPSSTFHSIRNSDFSDLIGIDKVDPSFDEPAKLALLASKKIFKTLVAFVRIKQTLIRVLTFSGDSLRLLIKRLASRHTEIKKLIVKTIQRVSKSIPLKKACRFFSISIHQFHSWKRQLSYLCHKVNEFVLCPSAHPNSLSPSDIKKMKSIINDPFYNGWPLYSIAMHALRNNKLSLGVSTWYKYVKKIGFHSLFHKWMRKLHYKGIRASSPNEVLHADITLFKNLDGSVSYIYFIMDNFSRYILSFAVETCVSAEIMLANLKKAFEKICSFYEDFIYSIVNLVTDGGPENQNMTVKEFVLEKGFHHFIAKKDIICSNSMVEALNKTAKYSWLFRLTSPDHEHTVKLVEEFVKTYNEVRPHISLNGLTPLEAYTNNIPDKEQWRKNILDAKAKRLAENQGLNCQICVLAPALSPEYYI